MTGVVVRMRGVTARPEIVPADVRRARIRAEVRARGYVRVSELTGEYGVSEVTIRSDLDTLCRDEEISRVHGGAMYRAATEPSYEESLVTHADAKRRIGEQAAARIHSGDTVILDVGSTLGAVAEAIASRRDLRDVTILTNSLSHALTLEPTVPRNTVIVTGGTLRPRQHSLVEPYASGLFSNIHADVAIIGCTGVDAATGITNVNLPETELKRVMVAAARHVIVAADGTKIGRVDSGIIGPLEDATALITDSETADPAALAAIAATGIEVITT